MHSTFGRVVLAVTVTALAASAAPALGAASRVVRTQSVDVAIADTKRQDCVTREATGKGVARRVLTAPADGFVSARLDGPRDADWDLALIAGGKVLNGGAGLSADELADSRIRRGRRLTLQVCRRDGAGTRATIRVRWVKADLSPDGGDGYKLRLVRVPLEGVDAQERLAALALDTTDHPTPTHQDVLLHTAAEEQKLRAAGFTFSVRVGDVLRKDRINRRAERRAGGSKQARAAATVGIPSGRTSYRTLPILEEEMKQLALANPGLVRTFTLPGRSLEGRQIMGIEIAERVGDPPDGRPEYMMVGTHHAREWPATEATIEFGLELIAGYKSGDAELRSIVQGARTYLIPVLNVDGYNATIESEGLNPDGSFEDPIDSGGSSGEQGFGEGAYKRKTCSDWGNKANEAIPCIARTYDATTQTGFPDRGVDPNRNYGVEWGGPGTENDVPDLTYHGPGPWSEPETDGFRRWLRDHQPAVLITNHTFSGLILRPPGTLDQAPVPDEERLRALGDAMAAETAYLSQFSYQLYDTSGTTDDYIYGALGGFSYTPEIGKAEFHPAYTTGFIPEYDGQPATDPYGNPTGAKLGGLRRAFTIAGRAVLDPAIRGSLTGTAPAGRTLRIARTLTYRTSAKPDDDGVLYPQQTIDEPRSTTLVVPADGRFTWAVNPSTQPNRPESAWTLTCEDGAGNVLETRQVYVARSQAVDLTLSCGAGGGPTDPSLPRAGCDLPAGFSKVDVARRSRGRLRFAFTRAPGAGEVTVEVLQSSVGRRIVGSKRVARFTGRTGAFTWNGRRKGRKVPNGVYAVKFTTKDAAGRTDTRRVVVERTRGRFGKRGAYYIADSCVTP
jgi:hypothetical protein